MFYCFKSEYKKLFWFILGLICGFLINSFDFRKLLIDDTYAINSSTWYNTNNMSLYSALIGNGSTIVDNGSNGTESGVPYIQFSRITSSGNDLILATDNFVLDQTYEFNIFSCGMSNLDTNVRTGTSRTDTSSASNVLHYVAGVGTPVSGFSISPCRIDMYNFKVNKRGNLVRIGISNNSSSNFRLLGFSMGILPGNGTGGITSSELINSQNTIISSVNSNNNVVVNSAISGAFSEFETNNNSNFNEVNSNLNNVNSNLTSDDFTPNTGNDFFDNSELSSQEDLISLVQLPIEFLESLSSSSCSPINLPIRMNTINYNVTLPCMSTIYNTHFSSVISIWQTIITGLICYGCIMSMIKTTTKVLDPEKAHVETLDL